MVSEKLGNKLILPTKLSQFSCVYFLVLFYCQLRTQFVTFFDNSKIHRFIDLLKTICYLYPKVLCVPSKQFMTLISWKTQKSRIIFKPFWIILPAFQGIYIFTCFEVVLFRHFNRDSLTKFNIGFFILGTEQIHESIQIWPLTCMSSPSGSLYGPLRVSLSFFVSSAFLTFKNEPSHLSYLTRVIFLTPTTTTTSGVNASLWLVLNSVKTCSWNFFPARDKSKNIELPVKSAIFTYPFPSPAAGYCSRLS